MFAWRISLKKSKKTFIIAAAVLLAAVCCFAVTRALRQPQRSVTRGGTTYSLKIENGGCKAFFSQLGLTTDGIPTETKAVRIPDEFDEVYSRYNELQRQAGLDLSRYRGQEAELLRFGLQSAETPFAVLIVSDGCVIGGHLTDGKYNGVMLPLIQ